MRLGLLGHPVAHSLSPAIHGHWIARHGLDATYEARDVDPARASQIGAIFRASGLDGANLTVPFKEAVMPAVDRLAAMAAATGSVNTLWWEDGALCGDTTDAQGFVDGLLATTDADLSGPAAVLGTGGAGLAVAAGLAHRGVLRIHLLNRSTARAERAAARLGAAFPATRFVPGTLALPAPLAAELTVIANCVSGPGRAAISQLDPSPLSPRLRWCDLNYWDGDPPLREALGDRFVSGLPMLIHQAALAFERWTGIAPDPLDLPPDVLAVQPSDETL